MNSSTDGSKDELNLQSNLLLQHLKNLPRKKETAHSLKISGIFSSKNLFIRPIKDCDEPIYRHLFTDPEITKYTGGVVNEDQITTCFNKSISELSAVPIQYLTWVVQAKDSEESIGILNVVLHDKPMHSAELGVMFTKDYQNQGYCCELLERFIDYFLVEKEISSLFCFSLDNNKAVTHILSKLAFKKIEPAPFEKPLSDGCYWVIHRDELTD
jgi:RimJ/RimL family protein N-acetyltransferase